MSDLFADAIAHGSGQGVSIGILDTGINDLPAFEGIIGGHFRVEEKNRQLRVVDCTSGNDLISHGTACADIIHRHAPGAKLYDVQVLDYKALNSRFKLAAGIRFGTEQGWDILNVCVASQTDFPRLREMTEAALAAGVIVVSAIDGHGQGSGFPAAYPGVISVEHDYFEDPLAVRPTEEATVCAHGVYVEARNARGEIESFTGSSFASPHVTALLARAKPVFPDLSGMELLELCLESQHLSMVKKTNSLR